MDIASIGSIGSPSGRTTPPDEQKKLQPQPQTTGDNQPGTRAQLEDAVSHIQDFIQSIDRSLHFQVDDSSGQVVVQIFANDSGQLIRQIPSEEALRLAEQLEEARSLLFSAEA